jgi:preprotein translocase subunit SecY
MIPIIFAVSVMLFPSALAQFFAQARTPWLADAARFTMDLFKNQIFYSVLYFLLVVAFTYFYTAIVFQPQQIAENLQKQGGFIPGVRPGRETAVYLSNIMNRIVFAGALFLGVIASLPFVMKNFGGFNVVIGGSSLIIVVGVVIDIIQQIDSQLIMRDYEGL